ncbi:MAG: hypothetical protein WC969_02495 [Elusimicrobiota bacterium]
MRFDLSGPQAFSAGVLLQLLLMLQGARDRWNKLAFLAAVTAGVALGAYFSGVADPAAAVGYFSFFVPVLLVTTYKEDLLDLVDEETLLVNTLALWYAFRGTLFSGTPGSYALLALCAPATAAVLSLVVVRVPLPDAAKFLGYLWHLLTVVLFGAYQLKTGWLDARQEPGSAEFFFIGMAYTYVFVHAVCLGLLAPWPSRGQSFRARLREVGENARLMVGRYSDEPVGRFQLLSAVGLQALLFGLNARGRWVPDGLLVNVMVLGFFQVQAYRSNARMAAGYPSDRERRRAMRKGGAR